MTRMIDGFFRGLNFFLPGFFWGRKKENLASIFLGGLI